MTVLRQLNEARRSATATVRNFIGRWNERREMNRLSAYPDAMLKDIGVSRGEIPFVVRCSRDRDAARRHPASFTRSRNRGNIVSLRRAAIASVGSVH